MENGTALEAEQRAFNLLMMHWLSYMAKTFPSEACFKNLIRLMSEKKSLESPMVLFFNNNIHLQHEIRNCDASYFDKGINDADTLAIMQVLSIMMPSDLKEQFLALSTEKKNIIWHYLNELLTIALKVHPEHQMANLPPSVYPIEDRKLFKTYQ